MRLIIENPALGSIFVLRVQNRIVGMANALFTISTAEGGPALLLEDVIVADAYRKQGLGGKLVQHVLAWAKARGFLRVTLLADRDNAPALRFYEKQGFLASAMIVYRHGLAAERPGLFRKMDWKTSRHNWLAPHARGMRPLRRPGTGK